jgi:hypothetical protein
LKRHDGKLIAVDRSQLSSADQEYLSTKEVREENDRSEMQVWTMKGGWKIEGRVVGYGRREVVVESKRGKLYANDRLFETSLKYISESFLESSPSWKALAFRIPQIYSIGFPIRKVMRASSLMTA